MDDSIADLLSNYHELNASVVDELLEEPSALEFMRYVARNRPFVVRNAASEWTAVRQWSATYLRDAMQNSLVQVATTPSGWVSISIALDIRGAANVDSNADAVVEQEDGRLLFVEPYEHSEPFVEFLEYIQQDARQPVQEQSRAVKYAQTRRRALS